MSDIIRVLRIVEYTGPRERVEKQIRLSLHGTRDCGNGLTITVATLHEFPEVLEKARDVLDESFDGTTVDRSA